MDPGADTAPASGAGLGRGERWERQDYIAAGALVLFSAALVLPGLSIRSIWGSEARWAVIAREMIETGDHLTPRINAVPYYDKPLPSYWAIVPFGILAGGVSERVARLPSAIAGIAVVLLTVAVGRRLFGRRAGAAAGALMATSAMFVFWSRTASADLLNMLAVWVVIWCFVAGGAEGRLGWLVALYSAAAAGSFMKGPVAAAAAFAALGLYGAGGVALELRRCGLTAAALRRSVPREFGWLLSARAAAGMLAGAFVFALLLAGPCLLAGDWGLARLMWRENVERFFDPFDHVEPAYIYFKHAATYFAPWSLLFIAALWDARSWPAGRARRFVLLAAAGVFLFFTASGSRRSYYILPLVPVMAIITGRALDRWLAGRRSPHVTAATAVTSALLAGVALAMVYARHSPHEKLIFRAALQFPAAVAVGGAALAGAVALAARGRRAAVGLILAAAVVAELWAFTAGMAAAERRRTFRPFCIAADRLLAGVPDGEIGLYRMRGAAFVFYLNRRGLPNIDAPAEARAFAEAHPGGFIITDRDYLSPECGPAFRLPPLEAVLEQEEEPTERRAKFHAVARCSPAGPAPGP